MMMSFDLHNLTASIDLEYRIETGRDDGHIDSMVCSSFIKSTVKDTMSSRFFRYVLIALGSHNGLSLLSGRAEMEEGTLPCSKHIAKKSKGSE